MSKVDVLLTYWGDVELFKLAVLSVLNQTEQDWKLLIFDDCYPSDEPKKFIDSLKDPRILYRKHSKNIGITANFNFALDAATSDYCVLLGCDDVMLPNYLERSLSHIEGADFYQPNVQVIDENGTPYLPLGDKVKKILRPKRSRQYYGENLAAGLCTGNWLYFPSLLWKTETIKKYGFNTDFKIAEDVQLELSIIKDGGKLFLDNATTFQYRRFAHSLSSKEKKKGGIRFEEEAKVYQYFSDEFASIPWPKAALAAKIRFTSRLNQLISK